MKHKKIDIVVKYFFPVAAGIETNILATYSVLATKGWDVTIHTSKDTHIDKNVLPNEEMIKGLKVLRYPYRFYSYFPKIDWDKTDVLCLHNFNVLPHFYLMFYIWVRKILGRKKITLILTPHGGFNPDWSIFPPAVAFLKRLYHYSVGSMLINRVADGVRAVSEWERKEIIVHGVKDSLVKTISNGIEDEAYEDLEKKVSQETKERVKSWGRYLIKIARVYPIKNYETEILAMTKIHHDVKFVILGPISDVLYSDKLLDLIEKNGLKDRVIFAGVVRGIDKYYIISHARLMMHMAKYESFCNAVHEGMSQGLVAVVADNTALPLLVENEVNGYLIPTYDAEKLSEKVNFVLDNFSDEKMMRMKKINREFGLRHSWKGVAEQMDQWYQSLLK